MRSRELFFLRRLVMRDTAGVCAPAGNLKFFSEYWDS